MKTQKNTAAPKYTRLDIKDVSAIMMTATNELIHNIDLAADIDGTFEVEEYDEADGTYFVQYDAKTWRDAVAFNAAVVGAAFAAGYFAEPSATWDGNLDGEDGRRLVSVFVAAADYMTEDGRAVA